MVFCTRFNADAQLALAINTMNWLELHAANIGHRRHGADQGSFPFCGVLQRVDGFFNEESLVHPIKRAQVQPGLSPRI